MRILKEFSLSLGIALLLFQIGCSSDPTSSAAAEGGIKISIKSIRSTSSNLLSKSVDLVTLTSARIVIDEIEFESSDNDSIDFELEVPFVQDLMLDTTVQEIMTVQVPFGAYEEMEVEIDELNAKDSTAFAQNPALQNLSIRVEGFLNGDSTNTFAFTSDLSEEQEMEFDPPLVIDENTPSTNVVLTIDTGMWLVDNNNNPIDPTLENNRKLIERNIKASLKVFEDDDDDGEDDDDGDD